MSTDDSPANKVRIAFVPGPTSDVQWTLFPQQKSGVISLIAGRRYYIEALQKEEGSNDYVSVAWNTPSMAATSIVVIPGTVLSPYVISGGARVNAADMELPTSTHLSAHPNPFNDKVSIAFTTTTTDDALVELYDSKGMLMKTLFKGVSEAGQIHRIEVQGKNLHTGMYVVRLVTAGKVETKKLIVTK